MISTLLGASPDPTNWDAAAEECLSHVLRWQDDPYDRFGSYEHPDAILEAMLLHLDDATARARRTPERDIEEVVVPLAMSLANFAYRWLVVEGDAPSLDELVELLVRKQRNYGKDNIARFGQRGIFVRMSDKVGRLDNMRMFARLDADESMRDSLIDLVGYAVLADMVAHDWFDLPLAEDIERPREFVPARGAGTDAERQAAVVVDEALAESMTEVERWWKRFYAEIPEDKWPGSENIRRMIGTLMSMGVKPDTNTRLWFTSKLL